MFSFFKKKEPKEQLDCLGYYDVKPYHSLEYALIYAKDELIEKNEYVKVYSRLFYNTLFVITLVDDEKDFDYKKYNYEGFKDQIDAIIKEPHNAVINLIIFQNKNEFTIKTAKEILTNTKREYNQILVYNEEKVRLEYYRPVPPFYRLYSHYGEAIYFDLAAIDPTR